MDLIFLFFEANAKTDIADVIGINIWVTAENIMLNGCLKTARNPAISVNLLLVLIQEVSKLIDM